MRSEIVAVDPFREPAGEALIRPKNGSKKVGIFTAHPL
jgi:hypothetical protein